MSPWAAPSGANTSLGIIGLDFPNNAAEGLLPGVGGSIGGGAITVGLKPGIINIVPVTKKQYKGDRPWVSISNFHVKKSMAAWGGSRSSARMPR